MCKTTTQDVGIVVMAKNLEHAAALHVGQVCRGYTLNAYYHSAVPVVDHAPAEDKSVGRKKNQFSVNFKVLVIVSMF